MNIDRETLGALVRQVWVEKAQELPNPKPSNLLPWEQLDEWNKEVDRCIGERIAQFVLTQMDDIIGAYELTPTPAPGQDIGKWIEEQEFTATRNGLRKEQRIRLWGKEQARLHGKEQMEG